MLAPDRPRGDPIGTDFPEDLFVGIPLRGNAFIPVPVGTLIT